MDAVFFAAPGEFRGWPEAHGENATELWVGFYETATGRPSITWPQAVDQVLCYGRIDGVRKRVDDTAYAIRSAPRKLGSIWSQANIRRVGELTALGRMRPAGLKVFAARDVEKSRRYAHEAERHTRDPEYQATVQANAAASAYFAAQPPSCRKVASFWGMRARREETRQKRLAALIADSAVGWRIRQASYTPKGRGAADAGSEG